MSALVVALLITLLITMVIMWLQLSSLGARVQWLERQLEELRTEKLRIERRITQAPRTTPQTEGSGTEGSDAETTAKTAFQPLSKQRDTTSNPKPAPISKPTPTAEDWKAAARFSLDGSAATTPHQSSPRQSLSSGQWFAALGALLTLVGLGAALSQLARTGFFTPEMQLAAAFALAAGLYALAGRARPLVGEALRGLGYGIAALCFGAIFQAGALPAVAVLGLTSLLSALVGWHAYHRREPFTVLVALLGASLSAWLLADDLAEALDTLGAAQGAALLITLATFAALVAFADKQVGSTKSASQRRALSLKSLPLLVPLAWGGLLVTAEMHRLEGAAWLWWLGGAVAVAGLALLPYAKTKNKTGNAALNNSKATLHGAAIALSTLVTGTALTPGQKPSWWAAALMAVLTALWAWRQFRLTRPAKAATQQANAQADAGHMDSAAINTAAIDPLQSGLALSALGLAATITQHSLLEWSHFLRLLPYALLGAVYGRWAASAWWQWGGAVLGTGLLLLGTLEAIIEAMFGPPEFNLGLGLSALAAAGVALSLAGGAGLLLAAGVALAYTLALALLGSLWAGAGLVIALALAFAAPLLPQQTTPLQGRVLWLALMGVGFGIAVQFLYRSGGWPELASITLGAAGLLALASQPQRWLPLAQALRASSTAVPRQLTEWAATLAWLLAVGLALQHQLPPTTALLLAGAAAGALTLPIAARMWNLASQPALPTALLIGSVTAALASFLATPLWAGAITWALGPLALGAALKTRLPVPQKCTWWLWLLGAAMAQSAGALAAQVLQLGGVAFNLVPTGLLLLCGLLALAHAYRRSERALWWLGLTLFGVGAAKLVVADLGGLGLGARGLGLALVGLLLVGIGQLAPEDERQNEGEKV